MYSHHCLVRVLLLGAILAASTAIAAPQDQSDTDKVEMASRQSAREAYKLAQRFRRANDDIELREQIADEAIQLGITHAEKVLGVADLEISKSLESFGTDFNKQIDRADSITAAGVVSSSTRLQKARTRLVQLGNIQTKLRDFITPDPWQGEGEEKTKQEATPSFDESLRFEEEVAVEQWLLTQGYRNLTTDEISVISEINRLREDAGLVTLEVDYKLCFAARDHSADMVRRHFFSHTSPVHGKRTLADRAKRLGTVAHSENIARCNTGVSPVTLWLKSKPHSKVMFGKWFDTIGVGRAGNNYTAMFARRAAPATTK